MFAIPIDPVPCVAVSHSISSRHAGGESRGTRCGFQHRLEGENVTCLRTERNAVALGGLTIGIVKLRLGRPSAPIGRDISAGMPMFSGRGEPELASLGSSTQSDPKVD